MIQIVQQQLKPHLEKNQSHFLPKNLKSEFITQLPLQLSNCFENIDDLIQYIDSKSSKTFKLKQSHKKILNDYFNLDTSSVEILLQSLNKIKKSRPRQLVKDLTFLQKIYINYLSIRTRLSYNKVSKLHKNKSRDFNFHNIQKVLADIYKQDQNIGKVSVSKNFDSLFNFLY